MIKYFFLIFLISGVSIDKIRAANDRANLNLTAIKEQAISVYEQEAKELQQAQKEFRIEYQKCREKSDCMNKTEMQQSLDKLKIMEEKNRQNSPTVMCIYSATNADEVEKCKEDPSALSN